MFDSIARDADYSSRNYRVLLVENDPKCADAIMGMLREIKTIPLALKRANRLEAGLEILERGKADLALLDMELRDDRDFEALKRIVAKVPQTPILVLNDAESESLYVRALQAGAQEFLAKNRLQKSSLMRAITHAIRDLWSREALFRERDLLRTVIDNLPDLIYVKDSQSRYILSNLYHLKFVGAKSREELVGKTVHDYFPANLAESFYADEQAVIQSGNPIITKEEPTMSRTGEKMWVSTTKVPLRDPSGKIVGLVGLSRDITERVLAEEKVEQYAKDLAERNAEMEADLKLANEFQQAVLPREYPRFPAGADLRESALRFYTCYQPCSTICGDFFDVRALSDTKAAVFVCDVMGHNVRAALVTAILDGLIEKMGSIAGDASLFLSEINRDLAAILRRAEKLVFASASYMIVDAAAGQISVANAGAPQPFLLNRARNKATALGEPGEEPQLALGLMENVQYRTKQLSIQPGDAIIMFTDGLYEVENPEGEEYGLERLSAAFRDVSGESLPQTLDNVLEEIRRFSGRETFPDDICLLGVELQRLIPVSASSA